MPLSKDERREGVAESFASLRLEGLEPTPEALADAEDYVEGRRTLDEIVQDAVARHTRKQGSAPD